VTSSVVAGVLGEDFLADGRLALVLVVSMSFQFFGFLVTFLLSTTHAGRNGARLGFGVTLIQYGLFLKSQSMPSVVYDQEGYYVQQDATEEDALFAFWFS
jgi:hypothetical protein